MKLTALAAALSAATGFALPAQPAVASCAGEPVVSAQAFAGTVLYTRHGERVARVLTDNAQLVTVAGTTDPRVFTSVDRTYSTGARYEFHPLNTRPPYVDNACTATHRL